MLKTKSILSQLIRTDLRRNLTTKVDRLRSARFVDIKSLVAFNEIGDEQQQIKLRGWINSTVKSMKKFCFFHLNDGLSNRVIQVVLPKELENSLKHNLTYGTSVICTGRLVESKGKQQSIEFKCDQIEFAGETEEFPFHNKEHSDDWDNIRQHPHLRFKTKHFASLQRVRSKLVVFLHDHLQKNAYLNVTTPIITRNDCEGGGEAFQVVLKKFKSVEAVSSEEELKSQQTDRSMEEEYDDDDEPPPKKAVFDRYPRKPELEYRMSSKEILQDFKPSFTVDKVESEKEFFGKPTFLTVSGQLHLEAVCMGVNRVYTLSPCFRSEGSVSRKHLCEFMMLELEESFLDSLDVLMDNVESLCKAIVSYLANECKEEIDLILGKNDKSYLDSIINSDYKRITYEDTLKLINEQSGLPKLDYGANINTKCETFLTDHFKTPVFITHFPSYVKPFYMKTQYDKALNFDLIYPICGEVAGGSLREDDYERLEKLFEINNLKDLEWYKTLRKEGNLPHAGFGLGIDRFLQAILGLSNIRDVIPFPRWMHHCRL